MLEHEFLPDFGQAEMMEIQALLAATPLERTGAERRDLRDLLWSSIDNDESLDLDQIEYCEQLPGGDIRIMIGIADVDSFVAKGSAVDLHAYANTTSVYTGVETFPMLPAELSTDKTSLKQGEDRKAVVVDLVLAPDGAVKQNEIYAALVRNQAKLAYPLVGNWLANGGRAPARIRKIPGLERQLAIQNEARQRLHSRHQNFGQLNLQTVEARPVVQGEKVIDLELVEPNPARDIIERLMISANIVVSKFLEMKAVPSLRRVVKTPERWDRIVELAKIYGVHLPASPSVKDLQHFLAGRKQADPLRFPDLSLTVVKLLGAGEYVVKRPGCSEPGHFALAIHDYAHSTAPNRRYPDLVTQRLLKACLAGKPCPYTVLELEAVARQCTGMEKEAKKVERTMRKIAAADFLSTRIGEVFEGVVTGVTNGGTYARLFRPPAEGRIVKGERGLDVGDEVRLRLVSTDPANAFVDFARVKH
jgi:exoribonuclease-2